MCDILLGMKDRKLLSVNELSEYLSIGKTKARELLHGVTQHVFGKRIADIIRRDKD